MLVTPTYGGGQGKGEEKGAVPKQVIRFLNAEQNRSLIRGVISAGNTNFGEHFCLAGEIISRKCSRAPLVPARTVRHTRRRGTRERRIGTMVEAAVTQEATFKGDARFEGMDYHSLNAMLNLYDANGKIQFDADKRAAREYFLQHVNQNTVFFHSLKERLDYLVEKEYYEPDRAREVPVRVHSEAQRPGVFEEVPLRDLPRGVQVLHELHAEDLRRQALPGAVRGPRRDDRAGSRRRRPEARHQPGRGDHLRPLPAGHAHVPQLGQGAARRARVVLPAAHRRQHGVDLARHQLLAPAVQARRRRRPPALEHPRVGRADQADREPVLAASSP